MEAPELVRRLEVEHVFSVLVPESASWEVTEDETTFEVELDEQFEPLYIKQYEFDHPFVPGSDSLNREAHRFLEQGIKRVTGELFGESIHDHQINGYHFSQIVAKVGEDHWWLARLAARAGSRSYFLLHANGSKDFLILVTAVLCEFYILAPSSLIVGRDHNGGTDG